VVTTQKFNPNIDLKHNEDKNIGTFGALAEIGTKVETHLLPQFYLKIGEDTPWF
jgi:hypothetical protein